MDLYLMILRFLFGMPVEGGELEPIAVQADGRTSRGRQRLATRHSMQNILGASTPWQRFMQSKPDFPGFWERLSCYLRAEPRWRSRWQDNRRASRI